MVPQPIWPCSEASLLLHSSQVPASLFIPNQARMAVCYLHICRASFVPLSRRIMAFLPFIYLFYKCIVRKISLEKSQSWKTLKTTQKIAPVVPQMWNGAGFFCKICVLESKLRNELTTAAQTAHNLVMSGFAGGEVTLLLTSVVREQFSCSEGTVAQNTAKNYIWGEKRKGRKAKTFY